MYRKSAILILGFLAGCGGGGSGGGGSFGAAATATPTGGAQAAFAQVTSMLEARSDHASVALPGGKILVVGGRNATNAALASSEIFDPATGKSTAGPAMAGPRANLAAILLPTQKVLVVGGVSNPANAASALDTTEVYEVATNSWKPGPKMLEARSGAALALVKQGALTKVLIAGGTRATRTVELYTVDSNTLAPGGQMMIEPRVDARAVTLATGSVLLQGGWNFAANRPSASEVFDPATGNFLPAPNVVSRTDCSVIPIGSGALAIGGSDGAKTLASIEAFDGKTWSVLAGQLATARRGHTAAVVGSRILVAGGFAQIASNSAALGSSELLALANAASAAGPNLAVARGNHTIAPVPNGVALIGGQDGTRVLASIEVFTPSVGSGGTAPITSPSAPGQLTPGPAPALALLSPPQAQPGRTIVIHGVGFDLVPNKNVVKFGGVAATVVDVDANPVQQKLFAIVPNAAKTGAVTVEVAGKSSNGLLFEVR